MSCNVDASKYSEQINSLITQIDFASIEDCLVVPSIYDWCKENDVVETNPFREGKCLRNPATKEYLILINQSLEPCSWSTGWPNDYLDTEWKTVRHLVLHEVAHIVDESFDERDCDDWAIRFAKSMET